MTIVIEYETDAEVLGLPDLLCVITGECNRFKYRCSIEAVISVVAMCDLVCEARDLRSSTTCLLWTADVLTGVTSMSLRPGLKLTTIPKCSVTVTHIYV